MTRFVGDKIGKLTLLEWTKDHNKKVRGSGWKVQCDCGSQYYVFNNYLNASPEPMCATCASKKPRVSIEHKTYRHVYNQYKSNSRKRKNSENSKLFELTFENVIELITSDCYYCGDPPITINKKFNEVPYNGIDRIDSNLGYIVSNVRPCCTTCNMMKGSLTEEEFFTKLKQIIENKR